MELNTQRLILRPITLDDAPAFFAYSKNPNVGPNAGWKPHETLEETIEIIKTVFLSQKHVFGIVLNHAPTLIGSIGLIDDPKRQNKHAQMLGYAIGEPYWGQGYMTEAF